MKNLKLDEVNITCGGLGDCGCGDTPDIIPNRPAASDISCHVDCCISNSYKFWYWKSFLGAVKCNVRSGIR